MRIKLEHISIILILIASISRVILPQINSMMLFGVIPALYLWRVCCDTNMFTNKSVVIYSLLLLWNYITTIFADNPDQALASFTSAIIGAYLLSIIFYSISRKQQQYAKWLMVAYWLLLASNLYYLNSVGLLDSIDVTSERLNDDKVNANDLAYYMFYVIVSIPLLFWTKNKKKFFTTAIVIAVMLYLTYQTINMAVLTASRQVLLLVLPFAIFTLLFYLSKGKLSKFAMGLIIILVLFIFSLNSYLSNLLDGSYLMTRMETDVSDDSRYYLFNRAIEVGFDNFFIGVGPGNFVNYTDGHFSHCSYTELFACTGALGVLLFVSIIIQFITQQWRFYKTSKDPRFLYLFVFGIVWAVYNILYAFYLGVWLMPFFYCLLGYSEKLFVDLKHQS